MDTNTIIMVIAMAYAAFLGYCLGMSRGYDQGADMAQSIYRR